MNFSGNLSFDTRVPSSRPPPSQQTSPPHPSFYHDPRQGGPRYDVPPQQPGHYPYNSQNHEAPHGSIPETYNAPRSPDYQQTNAPGRHNYPYSEAYPQGPPYSPSSAAYRTNQVQPPSQPSFFNKCMQFAINEQVEVTLRTNSIAMGIVVSVLKVCHRLAGWGYEVRYRTRNGQEETDEFAPQNIRPRGHNN
ncbi:hypothetical protein VKT23_011422 [Stygiomarasmius scandens]|uniref:Uncharacterized protein n=1 Tax=Marasmiellus scandens TaxID=2682957 RepID=A0ABR1JC27_9AGAR